jgi:hypothetical protein
MLMTHLQRFAETSWSAPDLLPQLPPPPDISDVAIMGPSQLSLGTEKTGDHPQYPWHGHDNIV